MKHTKGKWVVVDSGGKVISITTPDSYSDICTLANRPLAISPEVEANAKLIAAAPDMFEALLSANNYFVDLQNKCALTNSDERAWKLISKIIKNVTE